MEHDGLYYYFKKLNGIRTRIKTSTDKIDTSLNPSFEALTQEQIAFYLEHPTASVREVYNCELFPPYVPPARPIEEIKEEAKASLDRYSRETLAKVVDTLSFCDAIAGTVYSSSRGIDSIYSDSEIFATADTFLTTGKTLRSRLATALAEIDDAETEEVVNEIVTLAKEYFDSTIQPTDNLEKHKKDKIREIEVYDISENVNGFYYNGQFMWLDKSTRVGLVNTLNSANELGRDTVNIWYNNQVCVELDVQAARTLLAALELYATDCYNVTASHKRAVMNMDNIEDIDNFDITTDYPPMLHFGEIE